MFWILMGILAVLLIRNQFDLQGVKKDINKGAKAVRRIIRELVRNIRSAAKDAKKESGQDRKAVQEQITNVSKAREIPAAQPETERQEQTDQVKTQDPNALMAAMMASVPTLDFPKEDPKYNASQKYRYA